MSASMYKSMYHLCLLENWLPLAQAENRTQQWGYTPQALEQLILQAAPSLRMATSTLEARAILWYYHWSIYRANQEHPEKTLT